MPAAARSSSSPDSKNPRTTVSPLFLILMPRATDWETAFRDTRILREGGREKDMRSFGENVKSSLFCYVCGKACVCLQKNYRMTNSSGMAICLNLKGRKVTFCSCLVYIFFSRILSFVSPFFLSRSRANWSGFAAMAEVVRAVFEEARFSPAFSPEKIRGNFLTQSVV